MLHIRDDAQRRLPSTSTTQCHPSGEKYAERRPAGESETKLRPSDEQENDAKAKVKVTLIRLSSNRHPWDPGGGIAGCSIATNPSENRQTSASFIEEGGGRDTGRIYGSL